MTDLGLLTAGAIAAAQTPLTLGSALVPFPESALKSQAEASVGVSVEVSRQVEPESPDAIAHLEQTLEPLIAPASLDVSPIAPEFSIPSQDAPLAFPPALPASTVPGPTGLVPIVQAPDSPLPIGYSPTSQLQSSQSATAQSATAQSATAQPSTAQPSTAQPSTAQPSTAQPSAVQSPTAQSPTAQSPTAQSPTAQSPTAQSPTAQSLTAQSPTAQPLASQSLASQPPAVQASVVQAVTLQPPVAPGLTAQSRAAQKANPPLSSLHAQETEWIQHQQRPNSGNLHPSTPPSLALPPYAPNPSSFHLQEALQIQQGASPFPPELTWAILPDSPPPLSAQPHFPEPSRLEPSRLEPSRLEPSRLEPSRLEPSRLELGRSGPNSPTPISPVLGPQDLPRNHWATPALFSLDNQYGCLSGYPDGSFRGDRLLSRYEFVAGLDACLRQLRAAILVDVRRELQAYPPVPMDLAQLELAQLELAQLELAQLRRRVLPKLRIEPGGVSDLPPALGAAPAMAPALVTAPAMAPALPPVWVSSSPAILPWSDRSQNVPRQPWGVVPSPALRSLNEVIASPTLLAPQPSGPGVPRNLLPRDFASRDFASRDFASRDFAVRVFAPRMAMPRGLSSRGLSSRGLSPRRANPRVLVPRGFAFGGGTSRRFTLLPPRLDRHIFTEEGQWVQAMQGVAWVKR